MSYDWCDSRIRFKVVMNNRYKHLIIIAVILVISLLVSASFFLTKPYVYFTGDDIVLEKGSINMAGDFILQTNGEVNPEDTMLYTDEVGEYTFHYYVRKWFFIKDEKLNYKVVDTVAPVIEIKEKRIIKNPGNVFTDEDILNNITVDEGEIQIESDYDPNVSGLYTVFVKAIDDYDNMSQDSFEIFVKDNKGPLVFKEGNGYEVLKGSEFDINKVIAYGDNVDPDPTLEIIGEVDTDKIGSYPLRGKLTDYSGNTTYWNFVIEVVDKYSDDDRKDIPYYFVDFIDDYKKPNRKLGMDISEWQYDVDFEKIKDAGCEFVFMRLGFSHDGKLTLDKKFKQNLEGAKRVGMDMGVYIYFYENNEQDLLRTLDSAFEVLDGVELELGFAFDWEDFHNFHKHKISFQQLNHLYKVFEKKVNEHGYESILYGSKYYLQEVWTHTDKTPVWLAHYIDWSNYDKPYMFWQVSASGKIDGIEGFTDFDIMFLNP